MKLALDPATVVDPRVCGEGGDPVPNGRAIPRGLQPKSDVRYTV